MSTESKTSARKITAAERRAQAVELRKGGATYQQIGDQLGVTPMGAYKSVMSALKEINEKIVEDTTAYRTLELERLDKLWLVTYHQAMKGNLGAVDRCLKIMERRAKLLGLDAPQKVEQEITEHIINVNLVGDDD